MSFYLALSFDSPELIVWSVCIGFILGIVITYIVKQVQGKLIARLLEAGAQNEESAVTLKDLGLDGSKFLKLCLKSNSGLRGVISLADEDLGFENAKLYISEDKVKKATSMIKGGLKWYFLPIFSILIVIITVIVIEVLPILTSF